MTSPDSVGEISVEVLADAKALIKKFRGDLEKGLKDTDVDGAIKDAVGKKPIKVPVQTDADTAPLEEKIRKTRVPKVKVPLDPDTDSIPEKVKKTRIPKVPVPLDPVLQAFQQEVRRQTAALSKQAIKIPVDGDTAGLRAELSTQLAAIQAQSRIKVPTEPADKAAYEARLKAQLAEVAARVKQTVKVEAKVDVDGGRGGGGVSGLLAGFKGLASALPRLGGVASGVADLAGAFQKLGGTSAQAGGAMAGAAQSAAGPVGVLVGVLGLAAAAAVALSVGFAAAVPVLGVVAAGLAAVAGAAAAIPGALVGAGAAFGALSLGFKGISDAFKPKAGGGGGGGGEDPASRARRIAGAERGVEAARRGIAAATRGLQSANRGLEQAERGVGDAQARVGEAQRRALQAQQAVNRARKEAKEDIEDLNRELRGAALSEEDAALRVTEALRELNAAKEKGVLPDIQRADLEYRQAQQALEEAKDSTEDLGEAAKDANTKGVEGSDKVQAALQDQVEANNAVKDAIRGVADAQVAVIEAQNGVLSANDALKSSYDGLISAQDSLAEAQKKTASGGGGALAEVVKLAPAAQKFVDAIKKLKPAFEDLRLDVQQRLFAGLDKTVTNLGNAWIPALKTTLGSYADTFNGFFKTLGNNISQPKFISQIQTGAEGARKGLDAIGKAISGPLVQAFGRLSEASAPFLEKIGDVVAKLITDFSTWINSMDQSKLDDFFKKAGDAFADIGVTVKETGRLVGNLFGIIFRGNGKDDKSAITSFNDSLDKINDWLEDPANQGRIAKFFDDLKGYYEDFKTKFSKAKEILDKILPSDGSGASKANSLGNQIGSALIAGLIAGLGETLTFQNGVLKSLLLDSPYGLIGSIKRLLGIKSPSTVMAEIGRNLIEGLIEGLGFNLEGVQTKARELKDKVLEGIGTTNTTLTQKGKDLATGLRNGMQSASASVQAKATEVKNRISTAFSNAATLLTGRGQSIGNSLRNGINNIAGNISVTASNLKTRISNAFSNAGTFLYNHGYNTVIGLWNGIASLGGWLYSKVANFIRNNITTPVKNFLGISSPSKLMFEMGGYVTEGLALGIESEESRVARAAAAIAAAALPQVGAASLDLFGNADAAITRSLAVASANSLQATWAPGMTGDKILDALRGSIKFSHRGDVQAALGSA